MNEVVNYFKTHIGLVFVDQLTELGLNIRTPALHFVPPVFRQQAWLIGRQPHLKRQNRPIAIKNEISTTREIKLNIENSLAIDKEIVVIQWRPLNWIAHMTGTFMQLTGIIIYCRM